MSVPSLFPGKYEVEVVFTSGFLGVDGVDVLMGGPFCFFFPAPTSCKWREKNSTQKGLTKDLPHLPGFPGKRLPGAEKTIQPMVGW